MFYLPLRLRAVSPKHVCDAEVQMNRNSFLRFLDKADGTSMVEFALVGSLFSIILLGIIEFGLAAWQKNTAVADAREGARYAMVHGATSPRVANADSVSRYVKAQTTLDTAGMRVYTRWTPDNTPGSKVIVSVAHSVPRRGPFIRAHRDSVTSTMNISF
jgi:Flp pilus assembly protein TadG